MAQGRMGTNPTYTGWLNRITRKSETPRGHSWGNRRKENDAVAEGMAVEAQEAYILARRVSGGRAGVHERPVESRKR